MTKKKQLSIEQRAKIDILAQEGYSQRAIAKKLGISKSGVQYSLQRKCKTGVNKDRKRSGRKKVTTKNEDKHLIITSKRNRLLTAPQLMSDLNSKRDQPVSLNTVKRRLRSAGLYGRVAAKKPLLRSVNKKKRLLWAKLHKNWSEKDWERVLWTDESKFQLFGQNRRVFVRRQNGERANEGCVVPTVKHGGGSVMIWGCFGGDKSGDLVQIKGIMKKEQYHSILQRHAIPSGTKILGKPFILQQDNDPKHASKLCMNYLESKQKQKILEIMTWPPQSPDLSPIELAWDELDRRVRERRPANQKQLFEYLKSEWQQLPGTYFKKLLQRMPQICHAVIKAKGGYFDESKI